MHLLNGLYDAKLDQAPVLAITGMTYHDLIGTAYLQDINQDYLFQDVAVYNQRIMGPAHVTNVVDLACRTALSRPGVAHVAVPIDIQVAELSSQKRFHRNVPGHTTSTFQVPRRVPERAQLEQAAKVLAGKRKVAILAGAGARGARKEVAERLAAPVVKALLGKECLPDDSPYTTGGTGVVGTRPSYEALKGCEALLVVGSGMPCIEFWPSPGQATAVQIDDKPERIGLRYPVDVGLVGGAGATLRELVKLLPQNEDRAFLRTAQAGMKDWWALMQERGTVLDRPMKPQVVAWALSQLLDRDAIVTGDSGQVTTWIGRMMLRAEQRFSFSATLCSMAAGLPYAIGAQAAFPKRQVVAFTGDGSFTMMMGDFATLVQHELPVKIVVLRNDVLGLIRWEQQVFLGNPEYGVDLRPVDFVKVAEACGGKGVRIEDPRTCKDELGEALHMKGPVVIEAVVDGLEPPEPPVITPKQRKMMAEALARGEEHRVRIGLTIGREMIRESQYAESPFGVVGRLKQKLGIEKKGDEGEGE